uniref:Uncharacterized protein n=1 Tax=Arundo donax TaxID=35708 RepID=A0A0A9E3V0_ARUDO
MAEAVNGWNHRIRLRGVGKRARAESMGLRPPLPLRAPLPLFLGAGRAAQERNRI